MSRPLFPESNLTKIARERGGREQLERRPSASPTSGLAIARYAREATQTIATGSSVYVEWDLFERSSTSIFETGTSPASRDNATGDDTCFVNDVGYYLIQSFVKYNANSGFGAVARLEFDENFGSFLLIGGNNHRDNNAIDIQGGPGGRDWLADHAIYYHAGDSSSGSFGLRTFTDSASNQTIYAEMAATYLGAMSPLTAVY